VIAISGICSNGHQYESFFAFYHYVFRTYLPDRGGGDRFHGRLLMFQPVLVDYAGRDSGGQCVRAGRHIKRLIEQGMEETRPS
jgi:hypothetical protein